MSTIRAWLLIAVAFFAGAAGWLAAGEPAETPTAAMVPGDAVFALHVTNCEALKAAVAESDFGKLAAEPESQLFLRPVWEAFKEQYGNIRKEQPFLPDLADVLKALTGDAALTAGLPDVGQVSQLAPPAAGQGLPAVCLAMRVGDPAALARLLAPVLQGQPLPEGKVVALGPAEGPALFYEKGLLLGASRSADLEKMRARVADPAKRGDALASAEGWIAAQKLLDGPGHVTTYVALPPLIESLLKTTPPGEQPKRKALLEKSGATSLTGLAVQVRSRAGQLALDAALALNGPPKGLTATLFDPRPFPAAALKVVPEQATFCTAARFDPAKAWESFRGLLDEEHRKEMDQVLAEANKNLGLDLEKDLINSLGDSWLLYDAGGTELVGMLPGMAFAVNLKDPAAAGRAVDALLAALEKAGANLQPFGPQFTVKEVKLGETRVRYFTFFTLPSSPSIAIVQDRLFVTLSVNGMRRALKQLAAPRDITATASFKEALSRAMGRPVDLQALPGNFSLTCPNRQGHPFATLANLGQIVTETFKMTLGFFGGGRRGGPAEFPAVAAMTILGKLDFALFPSDEVFAPYLKPSASVQLIQPGGVVLRTDLTVPTPALMGSGQGSLYAAVLVAALAVPSGIRSRLPANESAAIAACKTYAEAQDIYRRTDWDGDGVLEYAQSIRGNIPVAKVEPGAVPAPKETDAAAVAALLPKLSADEFGERENATAALEKLGPSAVTLIEKAAQESKDPEVRARCESVAGRLKTGLAKPGALDTRFGLYQREGGDGDIQLVDKAFADAEGRTSQHPKPKAGYCFILLTGQGPHAPGGRKSYLIPPVGEPTKRHMTIGYGLVAYPAEYGVTGMNTFQINNTGTVYQKDLGKDTAKIVETMTEYDPQVLGPWMPCE